MLLFVSARVILQARNTVQAKKMLEASEEKELVSKVCYICSFLKC